MTRDFSKQAHALVRRLCVTWTADDLRAAEDALRAAAADALEREARLVALLRDRQWTWELFGDERACAECHALKREGHAPDCELAKALAHHA